MRTQAEAFAEEQSCPKCGDECHRESCDVGVGTIFGPWGCPSCGWSEDPKYDTSEGRDPIDSKGGVLDQFGVYYPPGNSVATAYHLARAFGQDEASAAAEEKARATYRALTGVDL